MTTTLERPPVQALTGQRGPPGASGRGALGVASLLAGMAPAVPDPRPHHRRGRGDDRGFGRGDEQSAAQERRIRHGAVFGVLHAPTTRRRRVSSPGWSTVGPVEVIENETQSIPGSINTYQLRAQDPHGPFGGPMLSLVSGHYPSGADQVAVTSGVASAFHLRVGDIWRAGGDERRVVGIVENPQSLLDEFALVAPGR